MRSYTDWMLDTLSDDEWQDASVTDEEWKHAITAEIDAETDDLEEDMLDREWHMRGWW